MTWVVVAILVGAALAAMVVAGRLYGPVDTLGTQQACSGHGDALGRPLVEYERSRKFALVGRTDGSCLFGPVAADDDEDAVGGDPVDDATVEGVAVDDANAAPAGANLRVSLADFDTGGLYVAIKWMGVVLQLGAASIAVRLLADPLLDRFVRRR
ncbi:MAG: hypothetical protein ACFCVK_10895 [Acidimicrobiales bacterium]